MNEPNHLVLLYLLGSCAAFLIKVAEVLYVGAAHDREDDPALASRMFKKFSAWLPPVMLAVLVGHCLVFGAGPTAVMWPVGLVVWMLFLKEDPADHAALA